MSKNIIDMSFILLRTVDVFLKINSNLGVTHSLNELIYISMILEIVKSDHLVITFGLISKF